MNWNLIKEKYPKAYGLLTKSYSRFHLEHGFYIRLLYDFFDEQGIYIDISPTLDYKESIIKNTPHKLLFNSEVYTRHERDGQNKPFLYEETFGSFWDTRTEAEEKAFEKAFEILEERL